MDTLPTLMQSVRSWTGRQTRKRSWTTGPAIEAEAIILRVPGKLMIHPNQFMEEQASELGLEESREGF